MVGNENLKWPNKDIPKFSGEKNEDAASTHILCFQGFLKNTRLQMDPDDPTADAEKLITLFQNSPKCRARHWFQQSLDLTGTQNVEKWLDIKKKFLAQYNPVGSTKEQQMKAWKDMKWDPSSESLDDFSYRYTTLATDIGFTEEHQLKSFICCIPPYMY